MGAGCGIKYYAMIGREAVIIADDASDDGEDGCHHLLEREPLIHHCTLILATIVTCSIIYMFFNLEKDDESVKFIIEACYSGDLKTLVELYNVDPMLSFERAQRYSEDIANGGKTYMWIACAYGHLEIAQWLFRNGFKEDIWVIDDKSRSPFWVAAAYGYLAVCQWLIDEGGVEDEFLHFQDDNCRSPFWMACFGGHLDVVMWLFTRGIGDDLIERDDESKETPFGIACINGMF